MFPRILTNIVYENILSLTQLLVDKLVHNLNNFLLLKPWKIKIQHYPQTYPQVWISLWVTCR